MEEEWGMDMDVEEEVESRKKFDEQKGSYRRSCETMKTSRVCRKRFRKASRVTCSSNCKEVEQRRHDLLPEHQKVQKKSQKTQSIQDKRRNMQK